MDEYIKTNVKYNDYYADNECQAQNQQIKVTKGKNKNQFLTICSKSLFSLSAPTQPQKAIMNIRAPTIINNTAGLNVTLLRSLYLVFSSRAQPPTPIRMAPSAWGYINYTKK